MTTFPDSPRLLKGGINLINAETGSVQRIIALRYNLARARCCWDAHEEFRHQEIANFWRQYNAQNTPHPFVW